MSVVEQAREALDWMPRRLDNVHEDAYAVSGMDYEQEPITGQTPGSSPPMAADPGARDDYRTACRYLAQADLLLERALRQETRWRYIGVDGSTFVLAGHRSLEIHEAMKLLGRVREGFNLVCNLPGQTVDTVQAVKAARAVLEADRVLERHQPSKRPRPESVRGLRVNGGEAA